MKILILCNDTKYLVDHRSNIISSLADEGHDVLVVSGGDPAWCQHLPDGVTYHHVPLMRHRFAPWLDFSLIRTYRRLIAAERPDVVHTFTIKPNLYSLIALKLNRLTGRHVPRLVLTFPGLGKVFEPGSGWLRRTVVSYMLRLGSKNLDFQATFENAFDSSQFADTGIFPAERCHVMLGAGIDLDHFNARGKARSGPLTFLFASRLLKAKGAGLFVDAAELRRRSGSNAAFLVAGPDDPGNPDNLGLDKVSEGEQGGFVQYIGNLDTSAMADILAASDVICLPTLLREGLPRILLEAGAAGCAVIASDQPSIRSIIPGPEAGWLVAEPNAKKIALAMEKAEADQDQTRAIGLSNAERIGAMPVGDASIVAAFKQLYSRS